MAHKASVDRSDPRRMDKAVEYKPEKMEEEGGDWLSVLGTMVSAAGLFLKNKYLSWGALLVMLYAFVSRKYSTFDWKQASMSASFAAIGLVLAYIGPQGPPPKK